MYAVDPHPLTVQSWSVRRLPFEPTGWQRDWRDELRVGISGLAPADALTAIYTSPVEYPVDAENVLVYNVGCSAFASVTTRGLTFERAFATVPDPPRTLLEPPLHHHLYATGPANDGFATWTVDRVLASWTNAPLPALGGDGPRAAAVWSATAAEVAYVGGEPVGRFGLRVRLSGTQGRPLSRVIKPLLDGIISAFHTFDEAPSAELVSRVASASGETPERVWQRFTSTRQGVLGARRLVALKGDGLAWNPRDDDCVACSVMAGPDGPPTMSGELFTVSTASDAGLRMQALTPPPTRIWSNDDWGRLCRGVYTTESGDRWWAVTAGRTLRLLRASDGTLVFEAEFQQRYDGWVIRNAGARNGHSSVDLDDAIWRELLRKP